MLKDLVVRTRSYRRFFQDVPVSMEILREVIDLARLAPSGSNLQSLRYLLSNEEEKNQRIFNTLRWAGYLKEWPGPNECERPTAYIIMLKEQKQPVFWDHGLAAQTILLGLTEKGFGACQFSNIDREVLRAELRIPDEYEILMVLAIGKPKEIVVLEELDESGNVRYWRDEQGVHHVPKRKLDDFIIEI